MSCPFSQNPEAQEDRFLFSAQYCSAIVGLQH